MREPLHDYYFSKTAAAQYLGRSVRWLDYRLSGPRPPPGFKINKTWIFRKLELDAWVEQFRTGSDIDEIVDEVMKEVVGGHGK